MKLKVMNFKSKKASIFITLGMFAFAATQILTYYIELSDFTNGCLQGISLGLMMLGLFLRVRKPTSQ